MGLILCLGNLLFRSGLWWITVTSAAINVNTLFLLRESENTEYKHTADIYPSKADLRVNKSSPRCPQQCLTMTTMPPFPQLGEDELFKHACRLMFGIEDILFFYALFQQGNTSASSFEAVLF